MSAETVDLPITIKFFLPAVCLRVAVLLFVMGAGSGYECGGFIKLATLSSGTIRSPNYPANYPAYARCIWILEAPEKYTVQLNITFTGETYSDTCSDYIQVYDGSTTGSLLIGNSSSPKTCGTLSAYDVTTTGRWMYVFFESDGYTGNGTGLTATYSSVHTGTVSNISSPFSDCRSFEFSCANKVCLSMSYRCDGYYDCGCGENCDEDGCGGLPISTVEQMVIGVGVGTGVFILVAFLGVILEKRHNWENQKKPTSDRSTPQGGQAGKKATGSLKSAKHGWRNKNASNSIEITPASSPRPSPRSDCKIRATDMV